MIFRRGKERENFFDALKTCKKLRDRHFKHEDNINQDISNLLTLGKLHYFRSDPHHEHLLGHHNIWINAFKTNNKWYESHRTRHLRFHHHADKLLGSHNVQEISMYDLDKFGQADLFAMGEDGDGLVYDPKTKQLAIKKLHHNYKFVCTHMLEHRAGSACEGRVVECNDKGQCISGICYCITGYAGNACELNGNLQIT